MATQYVIRKWFQPQWNIGLLQTVFSLSFSKDSMWHVILQTLLKWTQRSNQERQFRSTSNQKHSLHYGKLRLQHKVEHNTTVVHFCEASKQSTAVVTTTEEKVYRTGCVQFHLELCDWWRHYYYFPHNKAIKLWKEDMCNFLVLLSVILNI